MNSLFRIWAILSKEMIQMRRDRMTFAMMVGVPIMQLILFGFAINNDPKGLPTAVFIEAPDQHSRTIVEGFKLSEYFDVVTAVSNYQQADDLFLKGEITFLLVIPADFTKKLVRQEMPQLLISADASDPAASSNAIAKASAIVSKALNHDFVGSLNFLKSTKPNVDVIIHPKYNPQGITQYNIVPGLLGVILTMTSVMITSMAMTREREKGNLENILAMPVKPFEVMVGKIAPYVLIGLIQTAIILSAASFLFEVPFLGSFMILNSAILIFLLANLCLGFTFSTIATTQMQAMQMTFFFFLPSLLLSGFMFPFRGMPQWAQLIGEMLPLTHFLRIVRGVMLKAADFSHLANEFYALIGFIVLIGIVAIARYRTTLD
ncbi:ABC transporter permease [Psychrosphaera sp. 1_MG-2023]|uniref:ABC transporter permease n=1 Tax=Psychrosphaera sp. 1_MG-2023 TaxID=3062643 RepID=UPI0026E418E7|nr:ABC transporter permease [Psychrosphaera sp. 1_MG-2023]MDO6718280.1 ABC transporter permease [Psychrosphaera sp. 1_MG-2023]